MNVARFVPKDIRKFHRALEKADDGRKKAGETAAKVEGFRLKKVLEKEIRAGAPGGRKFSSLSVIASRTSRGVSRSPLRRLALGVRYRVTRMAGKMLFSFGFTENSSKSWQRLAKQHQEGLSRKVTDGHRRFFGRVGDGLAGRSKRISGLSRFFNLKKSTTTLKTPARPIIDPFWQAHERQAERNILINFQRKMRGERI